MLVKKQAMDKLEQQGKNKHEYDSDEDTEVRHSNSAILFFSRREDFTFCFAREEHGNTKPVNWRWPRLKARPMN